MYDVFFPDDGAWAQHHQPLLERNIAALLQTVGEGILLSGFALLHVEFFETWALNLFNLFEVAFLDDVEVFGRLARFVDNLIAQEALFVQELGHPGHCFLLELGECGDFLEKFYLFLDFAGF